MLASQEPKVEINGLRGWLTQDSKLIRAPAGGFPGRCDWPLRRLAQHLRQASALSDDVSHSIHRVDEPHPEDSIGLVDDVDRPAFRLVLDGRVHEAVVLLTWFVYLADRQVRRHALVPTLSTEPVDGPQVEIGKTRSGERDDRHGLYI